MSKVLHVLAKIAALLPLAIRLVKAIIDKPKEPPPT